MADMEKKRGRPKYKNLNISKPKELFGWNKNIVFEGLPFGKKWKFDTKWQTQALMNDILPYNQKLVNLIILNCLRSQSTIKNENFKNSF